MLGSLALRAQRDLASQVPRLAAIAALAAVAALGASVLFPIAILLLVSLSTSDIGIGGGLTLSNYLDVFKSALTWEYLANSIQFTVGSAVIAVTLGTVLAWAVTSIDLPARSLLRILPLVGLLMPPLLKVPAWIALYSPTTGLVNLGAQSALGLHGPIFDVFSIHGMIAVQGMTAVPIAYVTMLAPFQALDRSLSEASRVSGAGITTTLRRIVLPILKPALLSATLLTVILTAAGFETAVLIGLPAGVRTYILEIYASIQSESTSSAFNIAAAQSSFYLLLTALLLLWYIRGTRRLGTFIAVTGRGNRRAVFEPPLLVRILVFAMVLLYAVVAIIGPLALNALVSLVPFYTVTGGNPFSTLTWRNYEELFKSPDVVQAVVTSGFLGLAVVGGSLCAGGLLSFISLKSRVRWRRTAEVIGMAPMAIPAVVFSVGLLIATLSVPIFGPIVYGTATPMILGEIVVFMPFAFRLVSSALIQIQDELIEASTLSGASLARTIRLILLPILRPALLYAAAIIFMMSYRELGAVVLLVSPNVQLIPTVTFGIWSGGGGYNVVAALNMLTLLVPLAFLVVTFVVAARGPRSAPRDNAVTLTLPRLAESA